MLEAMKRRYRKAILRKLLLEDKEGRSIIDFVKSINIKDVVYTIATAWDEVPAMTIIKSWHNLLAKDGASDRNTEASQPMPTVESDDQDGSCEMLIRELDSSLTDNDISSWLDSDSSDPGYQLLSDEDIISSITSPSQDEDTYEEEEGDTDTNEVPTCGAVADMLDLCMVWYEQQKESTAPSLLLLKKIRDLAATKRYSNLKQLTLFSFTKS